LWRFATSHAKGLFWGREWPERQNGMLDLWKRWKGTKVVQQFCTFLHHHLPISAEDASAFCKCASCKSTMTCQVWMVSWHVIASRFSRQKWLYFFILFYSLEDQDTGKNVSKYFIARRGLLVINLVFGIVGDLTWYRTWNQKFLTDEIDPKYEWEIY
jgi:hypothetical protein